MNPIDIGQSNIILAAVAAGLVLLVIFGIAWIQRRRPHRLDMDYFNRRWQELQKLCGDKSTWPLAVIDADKLLDEALRGHRARGKTMGERLVTMQRSLSNNDGVWYAHKLRNKLVHENYDRLSERDVKDALIGFRQALKDLGALR